MKKIIRILYIALFLAICCLPGVLMPFFRSEEPVGKEQKAEIPSLTNENGLNDHFSDECNLWFTQMMPFRGDIITAKNKVDSMMLGNNANNVVVGKDGWLYTEEEISDFIGETLSERKIHNIAETLYIIQMSAKRKGADFLFTVAPNKSTIYPEYMPAGYIQGKTSNLSLLTKQLDALGVNYADLKEMLLSHKDKGEELYLKYDTHWNNLGALYGYDLLTSRLGKIHNPYSGTGYEVRKDFQGDLGKMLLPSDPPLCEQYYFDMSFGKYRFIKPRSTQKISSATNDDIMQILMGDTETIDSQIQTVNNAALDSIYVSRDSFFRALLPYFVDNYNRTDITRFRSLDIDKNNYDDIIYEIVERKLSDVVSVRPDIPAPEIIAVSGTRIKNDSNNIVISEQTDDGMLVYGILDESVVKPDSKIIIAVAGENGERFFEAFPIMESGRLETNRNDEYGFSAAITGIKADSQQISVIVA